LRGDEERGSLRKAWGSRQTGDDPEMLELTCTEFIGARGQPRELSNKEGQQVREQAAEKRTGEKRKSHTQSPRKTQRKSKGRKENRRRPKDQGKR